MAVPEATPTMITMMVTATTAATTREAMAAAMVVKDTRAEPLMVASLVVMMTTRLLLTLQPSTLATLEIQTSSALPLACFPVARHSKKMSTKTRP